MTSPDLDKALRERDLIFLSDQVANEDLSPEARIYLARIIRSVVTGEAKFPNHRPTNSPSKKNTWKIALRVIELRRSGWEKISAAVKKAAEEFDCSETKVWSCLRQLRKVFREVNDPYDYEPYDYWEEEERRREAAREEEERLEEARWEELLEEEQREQWNDAEAYLIETVGQRDFTDKEIEDAIAHLEHQRRR